MTRLLLIRHGQTTWNHERRWQGHADVPLDDVGRRQAEALADRLRHEPLAALYTSDLRRAADTAAALARVLDLEPAVDPRWREMDVGNWSGRARDEIRAADPTTWDRIAGGEDLPRGDHGETWHQFGTRIRAALDELRDGPADRSVAVVTHGGVIRALVLQILELPYARLRDIPVLDNTATLEIIADPAWHLPPSSLRTLDLDPVCVPPTATLGYDRRP